MRRVCFSVGAAFVGALLLGACGQSDAPAPVTAPAEKRGASDLFDEALRDTRETPTDNKEREGRADEGGGSKAGDTVTPLPRRYYESPQKVEVSEQALTAPGGSVAVGSLKLPRRVGTSVPSQVASFAPNAAWTELCEARTDSNGDGRIQVEYGMHGEVMHQSDAIAPYLVLGSGDGFAVSEVKGGTESHVVYVSERGVLVLVDAATGALRELAKKASPDAQTDFEGDLIVVANQDGHVDIHDVAAKQTKRVKLPGGYVLGVQLSPDAKKLRVMLVGRDNDGDGQVTVPRAMTTRPMGPCGTRQSYSVLGRRGGDSDLFEVDLSSAVIEQVEAPKSFIEREFPERTDLAAAFGKAHMPECEVNVGVVDEQSQTAVLLCSAPSRREGETEWKQRTAHVVRGKERFSFRERAWWMATLSEAGWAHVSTSLRGGKKAQNYLIDLRRGVRYSVPGSFMCGMRDGRALLTRDDGLALWRPGDPYVEKLVLPDGVEGRCGGFGLASPRHTLVVDDKVRVLDMGVDPLRRTKSGLVLVAQGDKLSWQEPSGRELRVSLQRTRIRARGKALF